MQDRKEIIYQVLEEILGNLAFLFFAPEDTRDNMAYNVAVAAKISCTGLFSGTLVLALSNQVLPEIARNMLGVDEDIPVPQQHDAFKELLNVICGNGVARDRREKKSFCYWCSRYHFTRRNDCVSSSLSTNIPGQSRTG